jgi:hypothetical protein
LITAQEVSGLNPDEVTKLPDEDREAFFIYNSSSIEQSIPLSSGKVLGLNPDEVTY